MTQLLEKEDYMRLSTNELINKTVEVIKKREKEKNDNKN